MCKSNETWLMVRVTVDRWLPVDSQSRYAPFLTRQPGNKKYCTCGVLIISMTCGNKLFFVFSYFVKNFLKNLTSFIIVQ